MAKSDQPAPRKHRLLTRAEVLAALQSERDSLGLTATAKKYGIAAQQLCDLLGGRKGLSKRLVARFNYISYTFYAKKGTES